LVDIYSITSTTFDELHYLLSLLVILN